jgi:hypothetical protein
MEVVMIGRRVAVVLIALPLAGCLEPPVSESLDVRLLRGGASLVSVGVALRDPSDYDKSPRVQQRLESEARGLEAGSDPWSERLRRVEPERRRDVVDREQGRLRRVVRHALLKSPEDLREFFRDTGVGVAYAEGEDWAELTLTAGSASRATAAQRRRVDVELTDFSSNLAKYAAATKQLYDYLETNPDRARVCLGEVLSVKTEGEQLTEDESALVERVNDAIGTIIAVFDAVPGEPYTLDEVSRLVYDPFPAPLRVTVPGTIVEREGFPGELNSVLRIPTFSIWSAFERLEDRWFSPDPALAMWRDDIAKTGRQFDLDAFLAIPRRAAVPPTADEVRGAIENQLKPEPVYRVRFTPAGAEKDKAGLPFGD